MRRRLNCAYLAQYFLMLVVMALLVLLAWRGAPAYIFVLVFMAGIVTAALPGLYSGYVLPRREFQRADKVLKTGSPAQVQILEDGETILSEYQRKTVGFKGVRLLLDIPVLYQPAEGESSRKASMKADLDSLKQLKSGMFVSVRCDPEDPQYVVMDGQLPDQL